MADSIQVPVEIVSEAKKADDLAIKINQIFVQKGAFRNVTESTLALEAKDTSSADSDEIMADDSEEETREQRLEMLTKTREELLLQVQQGAMEITQALDFFSLLLSTHSKLAAGTFSPGLKQAVKPGAFDGFVIEGAEMSRTIKPLEKLSKGWRAKGFKSAAENLKAASQRLKKEADHASSFWHQVAEVGEKGWKISRYPNANRRLGVHFGLAESATRFRNKGIALLEQDDDSTVFIDQDIPQRDRRHISVTISRNGQSTGRYTTTTETSRPRIHHELLQARDNVFHQELLYELGREARLAENQGIVSHGEDIEFDVGQEYVVTISPSNTDTPPTSELSQDASVDAGLARYIVTILGSLLIEAHRQNYQRRTRPPPPMVLRPSPTPEYPILRPLVASLRQAQARATMQQSLEHLLTPLYRASISVKTSSPDPEYTDSSIPQHSLISTQPQRTTTTITLPSTRTTTLEITTYLGRPQYGTRYTLTAPSTPYPTPLWHTRPLSTTSSGDATEIQSALTRLLNVDLAIYTTETLLSAPTWRLSRGPDASGSVLLACEDEAKTANVRIAAQESLLLLQEYQAGGVVRAWAWTAESEEEGVTFEEAVKEL